MVGPKHPNTYETNLARKRAVSSVTNVASVLSGPVAEAESDFELEEVMRILADAGEPLVISEVAARLDWDAETAAQVLARGSDMGALRFFRDDDLTMVAIE